MTPVTTTLTILLAAACLFLPWRYFPWPFIVAACLVPMNQKMYVGSLDFTVLRILVLSGMLRMLIRKKAEPIRWHGFDKLVLAWNLSNALIYTFQWGTMAAFLNRCGLMYDSLGFYWLFRHFFRSFSDVTQVIKVFAICAIISTPLVAAEKINQSSPFAVFGPTGAAFHRDRFRCAGPFPHFILMGCFWASILPFFYASVKAKMSAKLNTVGIFCAISLVYFCASSTPIMTTGAIILFWMCYNYRQYGKIILLSICGILFFLHLIMNHPVWHLMARVGVFGGSTGYHRFHLFNQFVERTSEWFLLGTKSTIHWDQYGSLADITNQYVLEGVRGGFVTLLIFLLVLYNAVKIAGKYSLLATNKENKLIAWGICVSLLSHTVTFWGVSYFGGQMLMLLYLTFAVIGFFQEKIIEQQI